MLDIVRAGLRESDGAVEVCVQAEVHGLSRAVPCQSSAADLSKQHALAEQELGQQFGHAQVVFRQGLFVQWLLMLLDVCTRCVLMSSEQFPFGRKQEALALGAVAGFVSMSFTPCWWFIRPSSSQPAAKQLNYLVSCLQLKTVFGYAAGAFCVLFGSMAVTAGVIDCLHRGSSCHLLEVSSDASSKLAMQGTWLFVEAVVATAVARNYTKVLKTLETSRTCFESNAACKALPDGEELLASGTAIV